MESRLVNTEQNTQLYDRKSDTNQGIIAEIMEKVEAKVLQMD